MKPIIPDSMTNLTMGAGFFMLFTTVMSLGYINHWSIWEIKLPINSAKLHKIVKEKKKNAKIPWYLYKMVIH